jgi:hypothetical protein
MSLEKQRDLDFGEPVPKKASKPNSIDEHLENERVKGMAQLGIFRKYIIDLALHEPMLAEIKNAQNLDAADMNLFQVFQKGRMTTTDIKRHVFLLHTIPQPESTLGETNKTKVEDKIKLLKYMEHKLENRPH